MITPSSTASPKGVSVVKLLNYLVATVDKALIEHLLEDPPDRLHEPRVHRLVVVVEVDPSAKPRDRVAPLL